MKEAVWRTWYTALEIEGAANASNMVVSALNFLKARVRKTSRKYGAAPASSRLERKDRPQAPGDVCVQLGYTSGVASRRGVHITPVGRREHKRGAIATV